MRLIPPLYVKPFVKRQKNNAADPEAIVEATTRPKMRFVAVKSDAQQSHALLFRTRELLVRQRTQLIHSLRAHLAEFGLVAAKGRAQLATLARALQDAAGDVLAAVSRMGRLHLEQIDHLTARIDDLDKEARAAAKESEPGRRLQTMPGVGPICALAIETFAPPMKVFRRGRDFSAWLGLVPKQHSSGGKERLGRTSKIGQRDIRRLLIIGAMSVIRNAMRHGRPIDATLARLLERKPRMVVAIALANRMARALWAMMVKGEDYRNPAARLAA